MIAPNTDLRLIAGVALSPKQQIKFKTKEAQTSFFLNKTQPNAIFEKNTYQRQDASVKIPISADAIEYCSYLMFRNTNHNNKWFYAYITKIEYVNDNSCRVSFELDHYQSWLFDFDYNKCMIERSHVNRWDANSQPIVYPADENLEIGDEYITVSEQQVVPYVTAPKLRWAVITCKASLQATNGAYNDAGRYCGAVTSLSIYLLPVDLGNASIPLVNGQGTYNLAYTLQMIEANSTWANRVASVSLCSHIPYNMAVRTVNGRVEITSDDLEVFTVAGTSAILVKPKTRLDPIINNASGGAIYGNFLNASASRESKLYTYPYSYIELCDYRGKSIDLKMERFDNRMAGILLKIYGSIGSQNYTVYSVSGYNNDTNPYAHCIIDNNTDTVPVLNNHTATYLQSNANTINATQANAAAQLEVSQKRNVWETGANMTSGILSIFGANMLGGLGNTVQAGVSGYWNGQQNQLNYDSQMRSMMAREQDIKRVPANITSQGSSSFFNMIHNYHGVFLKWKTIRPEYFAKVENYFKMFGYTLNTIGIPDMASREHFNYCKTVGCHLKGNIPQPSRLEIEKMHDDGFTVWHDAANLGNFDLANEEK